MSIEQKGSIESSVTLTSGKRTAKRKLIYYCSGGESLAEVINVSGFPELNSTFPEISGLLCNEIELTPERAGNHVKVTAECSYSDISATGTIRSGSVNYGEAYDFQVSPIENTVPFLYSYDSTDANGNPKTPVWNTAREYLNLTTTEISLRMRFSYYLRAFQPEWILNLTDTVNKENERICGMSIPAGCGLLRSISAETATVNGKDVIAVTVDLEVNPHGFKRKAQNKGYYCIRYGVQSRIYSGVSQENQLIRGPLNYLLLNAHVNSPIQPIDDPVWLTQAGDVLSVQTSQSQQIILEFQEKRPAVWSVLSLPKSKPW